MAHIFTTQGLVSFGWEKTKEHYWFLLKVAFVFAVLSGATNALPLIGGLIAFALCLSLLALSFTIVDAHHLSWQTLLKPFDTYKALLNGFLATLLYVLILILGFLFLVLPGIYFAIRLKFYLYEIIERPETRPLEAIKKSWHITRGVFWKLLWLNVLLMLLNITGAILLGLGLFITVPISVIAYTKLYRLLEGRTHGHTPHNTSPHLA